MFRATLLPRAPFAVAATARRALGAPRPTQPGAAPTTARVHVRPRRHRRGRRDLHATRARRGCQGGRQPGGSRRRCPCSNRHRRSPRRPPQYRPPRGSPAHAELKCIPRGGARSRRVEAPRRIHPVRHARAVSHVRRGNPQREARGRRVGRAEPSHRRRRELDKPHGRRRRRDVFGRGVCGDVGDVGDAGDARVRGGRCAGRPIDGRALTPGPIRPTLSNRSSRYVGGCSRTSARRPCARFPRARRDANQAERRAARNAAREAADA